MNEQDSFFDEEYLMLVSDEQETTLEGPAYMVVESVENEDGYSIGKYVIFATPIEMAKVTWVTDLPETETIGRYKLAVTRNGLHAVGMGPFVTWEGAGVEAEEFLQLIKTDAGSGY